MNTLLHATAVFLLLNLVAGTVRVYLGPGAADRMQSVLLFGTTTVALLLVLAYADARPALIAVALVFVMLAAIVSIAFVALPGAVERDPDR